MPPNTNAAGQANKTMSLEIAGYNVGLLHNTRMLVVDDSIRVDDRASRDRPMRLAGARATHKPAQASRSHLPLFRGNA